MGIQRYARFVIAAMALFWGAVLQGYAQQASVGTNAAAASGDVAGFPLYRNYTPADYGPDLFSQNWMVTQDAQGIIYVANQGGVLAYDGERWRLILTERQTLARTLVRDERGRIFVGAYGEVGYLAPDSTGEQQFVSLIDEIDPALRDFGHTWSGASTSDGVYFQTRRSLFRWDGSAMKAWQTDEETRFYEVFSVRDTLYVAQENVGLRKMVDGRLVTVQGGEAFADATPTVVLPADEGLLVGTVRSDLYVQDGDGFSLFETEARRFLKDNEIRDGVLLPDGTYAMATLWGGVVIMDRQGRTLRVLNEDAGLIDNDVKSLFVDRQDGLWMACEKGIARADVMAPLSLYDERAGLDGLAFSLVRHNGALHVGTSAGVFRLQPYRSANGTRGPRFERIPLLRGQAFAMASTPWGLLVATDRGVFSVQNDRVTRVTKGRAAFGLHRSRTDTARVYVGYIDGVGRLAAVDGRWRSDGQIPGFDKGTFFLQEDTAGNLWTASAYSGLWWIQNPDGPAEDVRVHEIAAEGQTPRHVFQMTWLPGDGLRVVTRSGIAAPVLPDSTTASAEADTLAVPRLVPDSTLMAKLPAAGERILRMDVATPGHLWVRTEDGVYWIRDEEGEAVVERPLAPVSDFNDYSTLAEAGGTFWMAGETGVVRHATGVPSSPEPVQALIRRVLVPDPDSVLFGGGRPVGAGEQPDSTVASAPGGPVLDYVDNSLRIEYAATGYGHEDDVEYRYRLAGFDETWSAWTDEAHKEYTNLPPGRYTFTVEARNPGVWTAEAARYAFTVLPPWYRTGWAYLLFGILAVGGVATLVKWRTAHLNRRKQRLERVVAERTAEVEEQARQLEMVNAELLRSNEDLQAAIEEKSKLLGVAAHDLKNPIFGIRALSEVALDRVDGNDYVERKLSLIQSVADETLGLITDLLASAASTAQTQLDVERVDIVDVAEWVVHSFQPQAERKDQRLHSSLPAAPCPIRADKRKLREAMSNLVSNAIKYSPHGAQVTVEVERRNRSVCFRVEDEGPGLSEEDQQRMFAPFQRLTPSPTGEEGSSGLGLYIVKNIIDLHDGEVVVNSTVGEGSAFEIVLPDVSSSARNGPPPEAASEDQPDGGPPDGEGQADAPSPNGEPASTAASENGAEGAPADSPTTGDQRDERLSPDRSASNRSQNREHNEVL